MASSSGTKRGREEEEEEDDEPQIGGDGLQENGSEEDGSEGGRDERDGGDSESDDSQDEEECFLTACAQGDMEEAKKLQTAGRADLSTGDAEEGDTPLGVACRFGHLAMAQWLHECGAAPS